MNLSVFQKNKWVNPYKATPTEKENDQNYIMEDEWMFYPQPSDSEFFVLSNEKGRPDLISYRLYGNPLFAWIIMRRNGILHKGEIQTGMRMFCPAYSSIIKFGSPLIP